MYHCFSHVYQMFSCVYYDLFSVTTSEGQVTPPAVTEENSRNSIAVPPSQVIRRHSSAAKVNINYV